MYAIGERLLKESLLNNVGEHKQSRRGVRGSKCGDLAAGMAGGAGANLLVCYLFVII